MFFRALGSLIINKKWRNSLQMEIVLASNTFKRFSECVQMVKSALASDRPPDHVLICDNSGGMFVRYLEDNDIDPRNLGNMQIIIAPENLGCAREWNLFFKVVVNSLPDAYVLVSNDDIQFHADTIALFEKAAENKTDTDIVWVCGGMDSPNAFSLFMVHPKTLAEKIGLFDENFKYPYVEDSDMYRRIRINGYDLTRIPYCTVDHIGSATLKAYTEEETRLHHAYHSRNMEWFILKWGVEDHSKIEPFYDGIQNGYLVPFNGDNDDRLLAESYLRSRYGY